MIPGDTVMTRATREWVTVIAIIPLYGQAAKQFGETLVLVHRAQPGELQLFRPCALVAPS